MAERIRILRMMAGGASYGDYNQAYQQVHGGKGVISRGTVYMAGVVGLREASPEEKTAEKPAADRASRTREVEDVMLRLNKYRIVECACGTKWKIPPDFKDPDVLCTRCGGRAGDTRSPGRRRPGPSAMSPSTSSSATATAGPSTGTGPRRRGGRPRQADC